VKTTVLSPYDNWEFLHPNGKVMFYGSAKLAKWYLKRDLASLISKENKRLQFLFEPKGIGAMVDLAMLKSRKNCCVVCGTEKKLTKHHVVPRRFRQFFPMHHKSHQSHDVLVLCEEHHGAFENHCSLDLDRLLATAKLLPPAVDTSGYLRQLTAIHKQLSLLLVLQKDNVPAERKKEICTKNHLSMDPVQQQQLKLSLEAQLKKVAVPVNAFVYAEEQACRLEVICREHFLKTMQPKHLPAGWSANYSRPN
jgi:hypothetical protein